MKNCINPECPESLIGNPKKKACCLVCKNRAAYLNKQSKYKWLLLVQKAIWKNFHILEKLLKREIFNINLKELKLLGFDPEAAYIGAKDEQDRTVFKYGDVGLVIINKNECEIINLKPKSNA